MIWTDIGGLQYYYPNSQWGCYSDPVYSPNDILLQANGFIISDTATIIIYVCDRSGAVIEDATAYFDTTFGSFDVSGTTYYFYNIRCNSYSDFMLSNKCFVLKAVVSDGDTTVFSKYTQAYIISNSGDIAPPTASYGGVDMANCINLPDTNNCNRPYINFSCSFDCIDSYNGDFYGVGNIISGAGDYPFQFIRKSNIEAYIHDLPNNIKRTVSINGRTQKTEVTTQYRVSGKVAFPTWKKREIERMLLSDHLYIDGKEYQSQGGTIFEQFARPFNCQYVYKLTLPLEDPYEFQIFGCVPDCESLASFYAFPRAFSRLFDDAGQQIATTPDELQIYFGSLTGARYSQQLPFAMPCPTYSMVKVKSSGVLPKFIYVDQITAAARVFPKQLPENTLDFTPLCNGVTVYNQIPLAEVTGYESRLISVPIAEVTGYESQNANKYILTLLPQMFWTLDYTVSSAVNYSGEVTLNVSISTTTYTSPVSTPIVKVSDNGKPRNTLVIYAADNPNLPAGSSITIDTDGVVTYTGNGTPYMGGIQVQFFMVKYNVNN